MSILYVYSHSLSRIIGCHGNHELSYNQRAFIFEDAIFLHLSGPIKQIYTSNEMTYVFNLGPITPLHTIVYVFSKISLIFMKCKLNNLHIGPLDKKTYQTLSLII